MNIISSVKTASMVEISNVADRLLVNTPVKEILGLSSSLSRGMFGLVTGERCCQILKFDQSILNVSVVF